jgi:hypothetical protein
MACLQLCFPLEHTVLNEWTKPHQALPTSYLAGTYYTSDHTLREILSFTLKGEREAVTTLTLVLVQLVWRCFAAWVSCKAPCNDILHMSFHLSCNWRTQIAHHNVATGRYHEGVPG